MILATIIDTDTGEILLDGVEVFRMYKAYTLFRDDVKLKETMTYNHLIRAVLDLGLTVKSGTLTAQGAKATVDMAIKMQILQPTAKARTQGEQQYYLINELPF